MPQTNTEQARALTRGNKRKRSQTDLETACLSEPELRAPGRPPKRRNQRERILLAAAESIATVGFEQCSLAGIATSLDLTPPALYHYYPTKQSIFSEIAMTAMRGTYESVAAAIDPQQPFRQQLLALMVAHAEFVDANYWLVNATIAAYGGITRREIEDLEAFESYRNKNEAVLLNILRGGVRSGEFRRVDIPATARSIYQLLNITRWYRPGGKKSAADFARANFKLICGGLCRPSD